MAKPKDKLELFIQENRYLKRVIVLFFIVIIFLGFAIWRLPNQFVVYTAPDVTKGFVQKTGTVPPSTVYGFARMLWETLNYCEDDCAREYPQKIDDYKNYLTRSCRHDLLSHFESNKQLYNYRSRMLLPSDNSLFSNDKIKQVSNGVWFVKLEYTLRDDVRNIETRNNLMYYPIKVVRSNKPLTLNPVNLEIDCYFGDGPAILKQNTVKQATP